MGWILQVNAAIERAGYGCRPGLPTEPLTRLLATLSHTFERDCQPLLQCSAHRNARGRSHRRESIEIEVLVEIQTKELRSVSISDRFLQKITEAGYAFVNDKVREQRGVERCSAEAGGLTSQPVALEPDCSRHGAGLDPLRNGIQLSGHHAERAVAGSMQDLCVGVSGNVLPSVAHKQQV